MAIDVATLNELIDEAASELVAAQERLQRAHADVAELREEHDALVAVLRRKEKATSLGPVVSPSVRVIVQSGNDATDWVGGPRTAVVEAALTTLWSAGETVGPAEIHRFLTEMGREESKDNISAALAHLQRRERAHRAGPARWAPGPRDADGPANAGPSDGVTTEGGGGEGTHAQPNSGDHGYPVQREDRDHYRGAPVIAGG